MTTRPIRIYETKTNLDGSGRSFYVKTKKGKKIKIKTKLPLYKLKLHLHVSVNKNRKRYAKRVHTKTVNPINRELDTSIQNVSGKRLYLYY